MSHAASGGAILVINSDYSYCSACGGGASYEETAHSTLLGRETASGWIGPGEDGAMGCGMAFTATATDSFSIDIAQGIVKARPDLPFLGKFGELARDSIRGEARAAPGPLQLERVGRVAVAMRRRAHSWHETFSGGPGTRGADGHGRCHGRGRIEVRARPWYRPLGPRPAAPHGAPPGLPAHHNGRRPSPPRLLPALVPRPDWNDNAWRPTGNRRSNRAHRPG